MTETIDHYATQIMVMIGEDIYEGVVPETAISFSELHEYVDANEYMIQADVPWDPDDEPTQAFYVAVQDEVTDRLARRGKLAEPGVDVRFYLGDTPELHYGVTVSPYLTGGEYPGHVEVRGTSGLQTDVVWVLNVSDVRVV